MATAARTRVALELPVGGVDVGSALDLVGGVLKWVGLAFAVPAAVAVGYGEPVWPFLVSGGLTGGVGILLDRLTGDKTAEEVGAREGFLVVSLIWLLVPAFGAVPFLLAVDQLDGPIDAYFESVSGFTATGASVLTDVEALDRSMVLWRQFTHWLGGIGIIVLAVAVLPRLRVGGRRLFQSEVAGGLETERLGATIRETARRLWRLYVGLTVVGIGLLALAGWTGLDPAMNLFEAIAHTFSVVSLGGLSSQNESAAAFGPVTHWILIALMVVAGFNFLRLHLILVQRRLRPLLRDEEARLYLVLLVAGSSLLVLELLLGGFGEDDGVRAAVFQGVSIMSTTGLGIADQTQWGSLAAMTLLLLMFVGASAGSTGGSIKVVRHLLLFKIVRRELQQTVHREAVVPVRVSGLVVDERALRSVVVFVLLYLLVFALGALALVIDARRADLALPAFDAFAASAACLGNIGTAFGFAGPFGNYSPMSDVSTGILAVLMWLGRLEIIPVAVLLSRSYWRA